MSTQQTSPSTESPQTILVNADYQASVADRSICVQVPGVTVKLPKNGVVGQTSIAFIASEAFSLTSDGGAPLLPGDPLPVDKDAGFTLALGVDGWQKLGAAEAVVPGGDPNAIAFFTPDGSTLTSDPLLTAAPVDQFGRPQIVDVRKNPLTGLGAAWRQGAWTADGDPTNQEGEGFVIYGANALGNGPDDTQGGYGRIKSNRLALAQIIPGVNGGNLFDYWRFDAAHGFGRDDAASMIFEIIRQGAQAGLAWFKSLAIGSAAGPQIRQGAGDPNGSVTGSPGDLFLNTSGGAGTTLWVKESGANTNTGWVGK